MKRPLLPFLLPLLLLAMALAWWRRPAPAPAPAVEGPPAAVAAGPAGPAAGRSPGEAIPSPLARLNDPGRPAEEDLLLLARALEVYRAAVKAPGGNPAGDNHDLVRALQGRNAAGLVLLDPRHPAVNARGELEDRWGTPYFFHALSSTRMEIRSAGPDRELYTADDLLRAPGAPPSPPAPAGPSPRTAAR